MKTEQFEAGQQSPDRAQPAAMQTAKPSVSGRSFEPGTAMTEKELGAYAKALMEASGVTEGDVLAVTFNTEDQRPLLRAMAEQAVDMNVHLEIMKSFDTASEAELYSQAPKVDQAIRAKGLFMSLDTFKPNPVPSTESEEQRNARIRAYQEAWAPYAQAKAENTARWNISPWPSQEWAAHVFPDLPPEDALRKLTLITAHATGAHLTSEERAEKEALIRERGERLSKMNLKSIRMESPTTNLTMDISPGAGFKPVAWDTADGEYMKVNTPTEEVFTTPDPRSVSGSFKLTRPVVLASDEGQTAVEGVTGRFENGKLVEMTAGDPEDQWLLDHHFQESSGTDMVGEVGLVDQTGMLARSGVTFYNTLLDENTGVHLGLGRSFEFVTGGECSNPASAHHDVVVGSEEMTVIGVDSEGNEHVLIQDGKFQV